MRRYVCLAVIVSMSTLSGCANFSPLTSARVLRPGTNYWLAYDASRRGTYISTDKATGNIRACAEPAPDTAYSFSNKLEAAANSANVDANAKMELAATALALAGRDRTVLAAREALFRLCEAEANGDLKQGEYFDGFQEVMYTVRAMVEAERAKAVSDIATSSSKAAEDVAKSFSAPPTKK
jgi:hypothetical protein